MRTILLFGSILLSLTLFGQKTKTNTAKIDFIQFPSVPVENMEALGIQVYTSDLPFNKDTLRLYLRSIDFMKSNVARLSKTGYDALRNVKVIGGEGDITIDLAFGKPSVSSKELKTSGCTVVKEGCTLYYYKVQYRLPAVVQARNKDGVIDTWELAPEMEFQFGNEQYEQHSVLESGSTVSSLTVINFTSEDDLNKAFNTIGATSMARKGILTQIGKMVDGVYDRVFFKETGLKFDIAYGSGKAVDYTETESASQTAVIALQNKDYPSLQEPIKVWESWLQRHDSNDKNAAVNDKVAQGLHENLSIALTFTGAFNEARTHLDEALKLSQIGFVSQNEVDRLKRFYFFIDRQEKVHKYNGHLTPAGFVPSPDVKDLLILRKNNEHIEFLIADDKYDEFKKNIQPVLTQKNEGLQALEKLLNQKPADNNNSDEEISLDDRVENNMLILSGLVDMDMRGKAIPSSLCKHTGLKTIRARNIGFTQIPECIGELTNLEKLFINSNLFEELPDAFGNMKSLEVLDISNNNLTTLPESIFTLTQLKNLTISGNQFSDADVKRLKASLPNTKIK